MASLKKPAFAAPGGLANAFQRNTSVAPSGESAPSAVDSPIGAGDGQASAVLPTYIAATAQFDAQSAFNAGREADAIEMFYADMLVGNATASQQYRWVSGLSRPTPVIRYGIGVEYTGAGAKAAKHAALVAISKESMPGRSGRPGSNDVQRIFEKLAGNFGRRILQTVQAQSLHCPFEVVEPEPGPIRRRHEDDEPVGSSPAISQTRLAPGVQFIGVDTPRRLLAAADKNQVDVLVFFQINRRNRSKDLRVSLVDVMRRKTVLNTKKLNSRDVSVAKADLLEDDPTLEVLDQIEEFIQQKLVPAALPAGLNAAVAEKRVVNLSKAKSNPLRRLAEIQFYRQLGLIDLRQQSQAITNVLDESVALTLIGGTAEEKIRALEPFLPRERSVANSDGWRDDGHSL